MEPPERTMFFAITVRMELNARPKTSHLIQAATNVDRRGLNHIIDNVWEGCKEVRRVDLWVEEDLRCQKAFIANVDRVFLLKTVSIY